MPKNSRVKTMNLLYVLTIHVIPHLVTKNEPQTLGLFRMPGALYQKPNRKTF
jgi:hypothetical protein